MARVGGAMRAAGALGILLKRTNAFTDSFCARHAVARPFGGQPCRLPRTIGPAALPQRTRQEHLHDHARALQPAPQRLPAQLPDHRQGPHPGLDPRGGGAAQGPLRVSHPPRRHPRLRLRRRLDLHGAPARWRIAAPAHSAGGWRRWGQAARCPAHAEGAVLRTGRCSRTRALLRAPLNPCTPIHRPPCSPLTSNRALSNRWRTTRA